MADAPAPAPPEITPSGHLMPDAETLARVRAGHDAYLASLNVDDPASLVYKRPDLAQKYCQRAKDDFQAVFDKHGIAAPTAPTPEQLRVKAWEAQWPAEVIDHRWQEAIREQLQLEEARPAHERQQREAELRKELGADYDRLVNDARSGLNAGETLPAALFSCKFALVNLASGGRYAVARSRAKAAAGL